MKLKEKLGPVCDLESLNWKANAFFVSDYEIQMVEYVDCFDDGSFYYSCIKCFDGSPVMYAGTLPVQQYTPEPLEVLTMVPFLCRGTNGK